MFTASNGKTLKIVCFIFEGKPGVCPVVAGKNGICLEACSNDNNCPRDQKCCSNGCGKTCQAPVSGNNKNT